MKDRIAFESSVMEKSRHLIQKRKQKRKAAMYTATSLCTCFIIAFGVFMTAPSLSKKAFDAAAPESAGGVADDYYYYVNEDALPNYSTADGANGSKKSEHDYSDVKTTEAPIAAVTSAAAPYIPSDPDVPTTTSPDKDNQTDEPSAYASEEEKIIRLYANAAIIHGAEIVTKTASAEEISKLADAVFASESHKNPTDTHTVRVVFVTDVLLEDDPKYTYYLTEADVQGIVP